MSTITTPGGDPNNNPRLLQKLVAFGCIGLVCILGDLFGFMPKDVQGLILLAATIIFFKIK